MLLAGVGRHRGARESRRQGARRTSDVKEALAAIAEIKRMERAAEYGKWAHWYRGEWLVGIDETREMIEVFRPLDRRSADAVAGAGDLQQLAGLLPHHALRRRQVRPTCIDRQRKRRWQATALFLLSHSF